MDDFIRSCSEDVYAPRRLESFHMLSFHNDKRRRVMPPSATANRAYPIWTSAVDEDDEEMGQGYVEPDVVGAVLPDTHGAPSTAWHSATGAFAEGVTSAAQQQWMHQRYGDLVEEEQGRAAALAAEGQDNQTAGMQQAVAAVPGLQTSLAGTQASLAGMQAGLVSPAVVAAAVATPVSPFTPGGPSSGPGGPSGASPGAATAAAPAASVPAPAPAPAPAPPPAAAPPPAGQKSKPKGPANTPAKSWNQRKKPAIANKSQAAAVVPAPPVPAPAPVPPTPAPVPSPTSVSTPFSPSRFATPTAATPGATPGSGVVVLQPGGANAERRRLEFDPASAVVQPGNQPGKGVSRKRKNSDQATLPDGGLDLAQAMAANAEKAAASKAALERVGPATSSAAPQVYDEPGRVLNFDYTASPATKAALPAVSPATTVPEAASPASTVTEAASPAGDKAESFEDMEKRVFGSRMKDIQPYLHYVDGAKGSEGIVPTRKNHSSVYSFLTSKGVPKDLHADIRTWGLKKSDPKAITPQKSKR